MSHVTRVRTRLKDGPLLLKVLERAGYRSSAGSSSQMLKIVVRKGAHVIIFERSESPEGFYDAKVERAGRATDILMKVFQEYSREKILTTARQKGYLVTRNVTNQEGQIEIVLRKAV